MGTKTLKEYLVFASLKEILCSSDLKTMQD